MQLGDSLYYPQIPSGKNQDIGNMHQKKMIISPNGMLMAPPMNVVDDLQKKGVQPLVVVIQVSEPTDSCSKDTMTPSKSAPP